VIERSDRRRAAESRLDDAASAAVGDLPGDPHRAPEDIEGHPRHDAVDHPAHSAGQEAIGWKEQLERHLAERPFGEYVDTAAVVQQ
jgi:hypothetical protein